MSSIILSIKKYGTDYNTPYSRINQSFICLSGGQGRKTTWTFPRFFECGADSRNRDADAGTEVNAGFEVNGIAKPVDTRFFVFSKRPESWQPFQKPFQKGLFFGGTGRHRVFAKPLGPGFGRRLFIPLSFQQTFSSRLVGPVGFVLSVTDRLTTVKELLYF